MEKMKVRDLMVTKDRFPKISDHATFYDALVALETAQEKFLTGKAEQRILLVEDEDGRIISKISPIDLMRGLETHYNQINMGDIIRRSGLTYIWTAMQKDFRLWEDPFNDLCRKAIEVKIGNFVKPPGEGQTVGTEEALTKCFHLFVMNRHDSLFVVEDDDIIGLLRFSDVYKKVSQTMKACAI
jgi:hypothetical protein